MNTHKLKYTDKNEAIEDLFAKGVVTSWSYVDEEETEKRAKTYSPETVAIVHIGKIVDTPATFNEDGEVETEATYIDGYHIDIMTSADIAFENAIKPKTPVHNFA